MTYRALKISQACSAEKAKLVRFLGSFAAKALASRCACHKQTDEVIIFRHSIFRIIFSKTVVHLVFLMSDWYLTRLLLVP